MSSGTERLKRFLEIEENIVRARLDATRAAIDHPGEKGHALEKYVMELLRLYLPMEYGLTTGFIASRSNSDVNLSKQLDIIIYDAVRGAPLLSLGTCDVIPLEVAYGYVEVKAQLTSSANVDKPVSSSIEQCLKDNKALRQLVHRYYWAPTTASPMQVKMHAIQSLSLRSYVVAYESRKEINKLSQRISTVSDQLGPPTHLHGVYVAGRGFAYTEPVDVRTAVPADYYHTKAAGREGLAVFKSALFQALSTFPRPNPSWVPAIDMYFEARPEWREFEPERSELE